MEIPLSQLDARLYRRGEEAFELCAALADANCIMFLNPACLEHHAGNTAKTDTSRVMLDGRTIGGSSLADVTLFGEVRGRCTHAEWSGRIVGGKLVLD